METELFNQENMADSTSAYCECSCCHRLLPVGQFYLHNQGGRRERRCKDCRRRARRMRRMLVPRPSADIAGHTDIFREDDRARRLELILRAKQLVRDSIERRARRLREWDFLRS